MIVAAFRPSRQLQLFPWGSSKPFHGACLRTTFVDKRSRAAQLLTRLNRLGIRIDPRRHTEQTGPLQILI
jgi:hypothetical protein